MALSNLPAAKRALYDALKAATYTDPQPGVWHSTPNVDHNFHDNMIVGPAETPARVSAEWGALGRRRRDETFTIPIRVEVFREGTDEFDVEERAWDLAERIQAVIDADLTLGVAGLRYEL